MIELVRGRGPSSEIIATHKAVLGSMVEGLERQPLTCPQELAPRSALDGSVIFELPAELLRAAQVERCMVQVADVFGQTTSREAIFLRERSA